MKSLKNKKVLITGGAGFIGSHLADRLIEKGDKVVIVDNLSGGNTKNINEKATFYKNDICDASIGKIFRKEKPEIVFHFAAQVNARKSVDRPIEDAQNNILGSINILENCVRVKVKKVIFASSGGVMYGETKVIPTPENHSANPMCPYAINKLSVESYLRYYHKVFGLKYASLRFSNVYGARQNPESESGVVSIFCSNMFLGNPVTIYGSGSQTRDFIYINDAVDASISVMKKKGEGIYNISTAKEASINAIFNIIKKESGLRCKKKYAKAIVGEQQRSCLDYSRAKKVLNWQPKYILEEGIRNTIEWYESKINYQKHGSVL